MKNIYACKNNLNHIAIKNSKSDGNIMKIEILLLFNRLPKYTSTILIYSITNLKNMRWQRIYRVTSIV